MLFCSVLKGYAGASSISDSTNPELGNFCLTFLTHTHTNIQVYTSHHLELETDSTIIHHNNPRVLIVMWLTFIVTILYGAYPNPIPKLKKLPNILQANFQHSGAQFKV